MPADINRACYPQAHENTDTISECPNCRTVEHQAKTMGIYSNSDAVQTPLLSEQAPPQYPVIAPGYARPAVYTDVPTAFSSNLQGSAEGVVPGIPAMPYYTAAHPPTPLQPQSGAYAPSAPYAPPDSSQAMVCSHYHCHPEYVTCGSCRQVVIPMLEKEAGACSWLAAAGLCFLGLWCFACLPFCCNSTKDTVFKCPACSAELYRLRMTKSLRP